MDNKAEVRVYRNQFSMPSCPGRKDSSTVQTTMRFRIYLPKEYDSFFGDDVTVFYKENSIVILNPSIDTRKTVKYNKIKHSIDIRNNEEYLGFYDIEIIDNGIELFKIEQ